MIRVLVFGTFDFLHKGHDYFLSQAKRYGDELYVIVARDDTVQKLKGKKPIHNEELRKRQLELNSYTYKVYLGLKGDKYKLIEKIRPNVIVLGYDQTHFTKNLKEEILKRKIPCRIVRLKKSHKPHLYKSSILRKKMENLH